MATATSHNGTRLGDMAYYKCTVSSGSNETRTSMCGSNGKWSLPYCSPEESPISKICLFVGTIILLLNTTLFFVPTYRYATL